MRQNFFGRSKLKIIAQATLTQDEKNSQSHALIEVYINLRSKLSQLLEEVLPRESCLTNENAVG